MQPVMILIGAAVMFAVIGALSMLANYPTRSDGNNLLQLVNKHMDIWSKDNDNLAAKAKAKKSSKIIAKTIISSSGDSAAYGQNVFFYDAAEGLLTATILLIAGFLPCLY